MLLPVRCFSCGKVLGHLWDQYDERQKSGEDAGEILSISRLSVIAVAECLFPT